MELLPLGRGRPALIRNHKVVDLCAVKRQRLQVEGTAEGALLPLAAGSVRDDFLRAADLPAGAVSEVQEVAGLFPVFAHRFLLVKAQGKGHIADFPAHREKADGHGLCVVPAPVVPVLFGVVAQEMIADDRDDHLLQADAAVHEVQPAAAHFDADALSWGEGLIVCLSLQKLYRQQILQLRPGPA